MENILLLNNMDMKKSFRGFWDYHGSAIVTTLCVILIILAWATGRDGLSTLTVLLYVAAYIIGGYRKAWEGLQTLFIERNLDVDLLMVIAAIGAASIGYWQDGAILIFIFSLSGTLEGYTMEKTNKAIRSIMKLRPEKALVFQGDKKVLVKVEDLQKGDLILIKPGERIPADGIINEGASAINQASITGESMPVDKIIGDEVFAGTINGQGALVVGVTKPSEATLLARIIRLVQEAQSELPPSQLFVEKFEGFYAKMVVTVAALLMVLPPFILDWTWDKTIYRAMIFLVVASPCALVSSIMPAMLSGISNGARNGILFKGGIHLENSGGIKVVAFDKTGTLTEGAPILTDVIPFEGHSQNEVLRLTAALESLSEHPIAKAIVKTAKDKGLNLQGASHLQAVPGLGVRGLVNNIEFHIGKSELIETINLTREQNHSIQLLEAQGKTVIFVASQNKLHGIIAIQDILRSNAQETIKTLKKMGITVVMLTGDTFNTAKALAEQAGVNEVYADLYPEQKVEVIKKLTQRYGKVAMVGDGVNDAPALAASSVGIAMGAAGTDVALETANIVLMADDLSKVPYAISLGQRTNKVVKQNLSLAIGVVILLTAGTFIGNVNLPIGVIGHEGSTLLVILSGLRLLR
ncbi:MAG: heavy metal translocating P-type ATPase [Bacillota bacterium]|nr:heavy metal translocating P-type ATPase [Bacillota bacterium]